jgi:predicted transcriptional regulator
MRYRHALYLSDVMSQKLQAAAEFHRASKSAILERALQQYLFGQNNGQPNDLQNLQHEATGRSLRRLERDLAIATELTATCVRYYLTITPPLPESEHAAARALGQLRFEQVIEDIARRLRTDRSLMARVMATMAGQRHETDPDNRPQDEDDAAPASEPIQHRPNPDNADG